MPRQQGWFALVLALAIAACSVYLTFPLQLGLDLKGGSQLTLEIQPTEEIERVNSEQVEAVKVVLDRRVNGLGVAESTLQTIGTNQLLLELPGEQDPSKASRILGKTALLEFRTQKSGTDEALRKFRTLRFEFNNTFKDELNDQKSNKNEEELKQEEINKYKKLLGIDILPASKYDQILVLKKYF